MEFLSRAMTGIGDAVSSGVHATGEAASSAATWVGRTKVGGVATGVGSAVGALYDKTTKDVSLPDSPGKIINYPPKVDSNEDWPADVPLLIKLPPPGRAQTTGTVAVQQTGQAANLSPPLETFLYLDVGRWGGSKTQIRRDFGIVCGRTAALCSYPQATKQIFPSGVNPIPNPHGSKEITNINNLLTKLKSARMGPVSVRRCLTARTIVPPTSGDPADQIYVIVGDMHLPVVTDPLGRQEGDGSTYVRVKDVPDGKRMGRTRRFEYMKNGEVMSDDDALTWFDLYVKGEIFEEAGPDLTSFVSALNAATLGKSSTDPTLCLLQLGDMFDLWLGMDRYFDPDPPGGNDASKGKVVISAPTAASSTAPGATTPTTATQFVEFWVDRTMRETSQGAAVQNFLDYQGEKKWLYGNHDNYLGKLSPSHLMDLSGAKREEHFYDARARLYAAHGHQWDANNRDGATMGQAMTQLAFWAGTWVRPLEPDGRKPLLLGVANLFRRTQDTAAFCVFAMGHTHDAVLTEVVIEDLDPEPIEIDPNTD